MKFHVLSCEVNLPIRFYRKGNAQVYREEINLGLFCLMWLENLFNDLYYLRCRKEKNNYARERKEQYKVFKSKSWSFKSFFDTTSGMTIWNRDQLKDRERNGEVVLTHDEAERYAKKQKNYIKEKSRQEWRKRAEPKVEEFLRRQGDKEQRDIPGSANGRPAGFELANRGSTPFPGKEQS